MINHESLSSDNNENIDFSFDYDKMLDYLNFHEDYMLHCASKDMIEKLFKSLIDKCVLGKWKTGDKIGYMINPYILINYQVIVTRFRPDVALFQKTKWEKYNEKIWNEVIMMYY